MALVVKDRVQETTTTTGTGTLTLGGAVTGFQTFSTAIGNTNTTYYAISSESSEFEVGIGTVAAGTLARTTILASSNGGSVVNLSAGTKNVFCTQPAGKSLFTDASGNAIALGTPASATLTNATGLPIATGVSGLGTGVATFLATPSSANLASAVTNETGSGALVFGTSPTLVTPVLGTPASGNLANCTFPTLNQSTTGNAATATALQTARTINGTSFDGTANITITAAATNVNTQLASLGVGTAASGTGGEIRATNNVTAFFSDRRLKDIVGPINNALEKVSKISGVYYTQNKLAESFGYNNYEQQVGVIAQEIQEVLPEVVKFAPFDREMKDGKEMSKSGEEYLTVQYDKLVPLLIEAIKELSDKVKVLEDK